MTVSCEAATRLIKGRYEVEAWRRGGMSSVYQGVDRSTGQAIVAKTAAVADFDGTAALVRERETLVRLSHPGIVRALDLFVEGDDTWLVLERVPGRSLDEVGITDERTVRRWGVQLANALAYLHAQSPPLIYRDLKPSNVMLRPDGRVVLVDFGAARVQSGRRDTVALGTPGYAAPEQYPHRGGASDPRTDVYALGITLLELLSGLEPGADPDAAARHVSPALGAVLRKAVAPRPEARFASAVAMSAALRGARAWVAPLRAAAVVGAVFGLAALLERVAVISWPARYAAGVACCVAASLLAMAWYGGSDPAAADRPRWQRGLARGAVLLLAGLLGAAPLVLPVPYVNGILRRLALAAGASAVPFEAPAPAWWAVGGALAALGFLVGRATRRRHGWVAPLLAVILLAGILGGWERRQAGIDALAALPLGAAPSLWTTPLPSLPEPFVDMTQIRATDGGGAFLAVKDGRHRFTVFDGADGRALWSDAVGRLPLNSDGGVLYQIVGNTFTGRAPQSGATVWRYVGDAAIHDFFYGRDVYLLAQENGQVLAIDKRRHDVRWTWRDRGAYTHLMAARDGRVIVRSREPAVLTALDETSGRVLWSRPLQSRRGARSMPVGQWLVLTHAEGLEGLDPADGHTVFTCAIPTGLSGPDRWEAARVSEAGDGLLVVQAGSWIGGLRVSDGTLVWQARLPGEQADLQQSMPGVLFASTHSSKLLGLDPRSGQVTWETWPGGWGTRPPDFAFVEPAGPCVFVQPHGSSEVQVLDAATGHGLRRFALARGARLRRILDDGQRTYCVTQIGAGGRLQATASEPSGGTR